MNQPSWKRTPDFFGFRQAAHLYANTGRLLLLLAAIVLIAIPFTQEIWTWDHFLRGGHDFETNLLLFVTTMCLVLVLTQSCNQRMTLLFTSPAWFSPPPRSTVAPVARDSFSRGVRILDDPGAAYKLPLLI